jgi:hypothetical protein
LPASELRYALKASTPLWNASKTLVFRLLFKKKNRHAVLSYVLVHQPFLASDSLNFGKHDWLFAFVVGYKMWVSPFSHLVEDQRTIYHLIPTETVSYEILVVCGSDIRSL